MSEFKFNNDIKFDNKWIIEEIKEHEYHMICPYCGHKYRFNLTNTSITPKRISLSIEHRYCGVCGGLVCTINKEN